MNVRQKLFLGAAGLTLIPVILTAALLWRGASTLSGQTVDSLTQAQLVSLRDTKRAQITDEITSRVRNLQVLAAQRSTIEAYRAFKTSYAVAAKETPKLDANAARERMLEYVNTQFKPEYAKRNVQSSAEMVPFIDVRDPNGVALQSEFIVNNSNPLGQKERLIVPAVDTTYAKVHAQYHPSFERAQKLFEFYDIFLIDTDSDTIVYTVFKELDFGTPLGNGIAAKTKLAEAYQKVKNAPNRDTVYLSDFAPYLASYDDQAAFVAAPIFEGDRQIGVIAMQYPIDKITDQMNSDKGWKKIGLGDTGDAYLVGPDKKMRSNARYLIENKDTFVGALGDKVKATDRAEIVKKATSIGLVSIDTEDVRLAATGQEGYGEVVDYRGIPSFSAYAPLKVQGLNWSIVTKIDKQEANTPNDRLDRDSLLRALAIAFGVMVLAGLIVNWFLKRFMRPIEKLSDTVKSVSAGTMDARSKLVEADEIGDLGRSFDNLLDERNAQLTKITNENENLNNSVITLLQTVFQLSNRDLTVRAPVTEDVVGTVSSSINQLADETGKTLSEVRDIAQSVRTLSDSVRSQSLLVDETAREEQTSLKSMSHSLGEVTQQLSRVATLSDQSNKAAERASGATSAALIAVNGTVRGMDQLREIISEMEKRFKRLGERSQEISTAVQLINTISERTHVLAVNASMQAATAGEAGRGFSVVATEVQRLSDNSRQATAQISQLVTNIQSDTTETLTTVNRLIGEVVKQSALAQQAGTQMTETQATTQQLVGLVKEIAGFSRTQADLAMSLQQSVLQLNEGAGKTSQAIASQTSSTESLAKIAQKLTESVDQFKLPLQGA
jgi:methyl-accepting chemotaxis protein